MKKIIPLALLLIALQMGRTMAQDDSKSYFTSGTEFIFSFASIDNDGMDGNNIMRFSGFFNLQGMYNYDFGRSAGLFTGLAIRNVGFIEDFPDSGLRKKYRTYNIGIPVGIKLGSMGGTHLFAGYEIEFPINYKEKTFNNERKDDKFNVWFTSRVPTIYNTVMVGVQFNFGLSLKFKYYLTNFFNESYSEVNNAGETIYPFANKDVRIFYFSLSFNLFRNNHFTYTRFEY